MQAKKHAFGQFEHTGWERVAGSYEATWGSLTRLFIPALVEAAGLMSGAQLMDMACGPGFVSEAAAQRGAETIGVDFSQKMVEIASSRLPGMDFREGDAQSLDFPAEQFDVVAMNFGVLHLPDPPKAFKETARVLKPGGRFVFNTWAGPELSPGAKIVEDAVSAHANLDVDLPQGPDYFAYSNEREIHSVLVECGFDGTTLAFSTVTEEWMVPTASHIFELERDHGVRTAALLAAQSQDALRAIQAQIERGVQQFATEGGFAVPYAAHIVAIQLG